MKTLIRLYLISMIISSSSLLAQEPHDIKIDATHVIVQDLAKPVVVEAQGAKKTYNQCYIVELSGQFTQKNFQLFIGDYQVEDLKITKNKVSFVIYDSRLLKYLHNQNLSWGQNDQKIAELPFVFRPIIHNEENREESISIRGITISEIDLPRVFTVAKNGEEKSYTKAHKVSLQGNFMVDRAIPVEIYIGDYKVPEYGGAADGIYFKIYDKELLKSLNNQFIAYGFDNQKWRISSLQLKLD